MVKFEADGKQAAPAGADDSIFFHWLWSYGGDFLTADKTQAATTSPEALAAAEWYARMHTSERVFMRDGIDKRDGIAFNLGNIAINGNGIPNSLPDWNRFPFKVDVFQRPRVAGSSASGRVNRMYIDGYLLFKGSKYRDATVDFLFWLLDEGAVSIEKQGGVNIPVYKKVAETVFLTASSPFSRKKWLDARSLDQDRSGPRQVDPGSERHLRQVHRPAAHGPGRPAGGDDRDGRRDQRRAGRVQAPEGALRARASGRALNCLRPRVRRRAYRVLPRASTGQTPPPRPRARRPPHPGGWS